MRGKNKVFGKVFENKPQGKELAGQPKHTPKVATHTGNLYVLGMANQTLSLSCIVPQNHPRCLIKHRATQAAQQRHITPALLQVF